MFLVFGLAKKFANLMSIGSGFFFRPGFFRLVLAINEIGVFICLVQHKIIKKIESSTKILIIFLLFCKVCFYFLEIYLIDIKLISILFRSKLNSFKQYKED